MIDLKSIKHFSDFSLRSAWNLSRNSIPLFEKAATSQPLSCPDKMNFIEQFCALRKIKASVDAYQPSWTRLIYDLITATTMVIKAYLLRENVSKISSQIRNVARIIHNDPVVKKIFFVSKAFTHMNDTGIVSDTDKLVLAYFNNAYRQLEQNQNVPLPRMYHSFKGNYFNDILKANQLTENFCRLRVTTRPCGSTRDEWFDDDFAIAFDPDNAWGNSPVEYVVRKERYSDHVHNVIWAYAENHPAKLDATTIAFYVTSDAKQVSELVKKNITVVSREVSERIRHILETVELAQNGTRIVPNHWKQRGAIWT